MRSSFLLDPDIHFLNHGSFGACPRPVFEAYRDWQLKLERQPVLFLGRELVRYDQQARQALGEYLHAEAADLVFIPNATYGVNIVARSLDLRPGGIFHYGMRTPHGQEMWGRFVYREIIPQRRIVWVNSFSDAQGGLTRHPGSMDWPLEMLVMASFAAEICVWALAVATVHQPTRAV